MLHFHQFPFHFTFSSQFGLFPLFPFGVFFDLSLSLLVSQTGEILFECIAISETLTNSNFVPLRFGYNFPDSNLLFHNQITKSGHHKVPLSQGRPAKWTRCTSMQEQPIDTSFTESMVTRTDEQGQFRVQVPCTFTNWTHFLFFL